MAATRRMRAFATVAVSALSTVAAAMLFTGAHAPMARAGLAGASQVEGLGALWAIGCAANGSDLAINSLSETPSGYTATLAAHFPVQLADCRIKVASGRAGGNVLIAAEQRIEPGHSIVPGLFSLDLASLQLVRLGSLSTPATGTLMPESLALGPRGATNVWAANAQTIRQWSTANNPATGIAINQSLPRLGPGILLGDGTGTVALAESAWDGVRVSPSDSSASPTVFSGTPPPGTLEQAIVTPSGSVALGYRQPSGSLRLAALNLHTLELEAVPGEIPALAGQPQSLVAMGTTGALDSAQSGITLFALVLAPTLPGTGMNLAAGLWAALALVVAAAGAGIAEALRRRRGH